MGIYSTENISIINEVYFGQTPGITRVFEAFCKFRDKYINARKLFTGNIDSLHDPDLGVFISEMEREFGIYSYSFIVEYDDTVNMSTIIPFFRPLKQGKVVKVTKSGFRFDEKAEIGMITIAPSGLLFSDELTDREVFSIILHEIGHNFQQVSNGSIQSLTSISNIMLLYQLVINMIYDPITAVKDISLLSIFSNPGVKTISKFFNKFSISETRTLLTYFSFLKGIITNIENIVDDTVSLLIKPIFLIFAAIQRIFGNILDPFNSIKGYLGEKFADNFASYYGFGPDIASALRKIRPIGGIKTGIDHYINKIPLVSNFYNLLLTPGIILVEISDCHPSTPARVKGILNSMENDLNDPRISPKMKKQIKKEMDIIEKQNREFYEKISSSDPSYVKDLFDKYIFYTCNGGKKLKFFTSIFNFEKDTSDSINKLERWTNNESTSFIDNIEIK